MSLDQGPELERRRRRYGGSEPSMPSFLRPQHLRYNSLLKSRDLGVTDNLSAVLSGVVGGQSGSSTLFFRVATRGPARLGVALTPGDRYSDRALRVGICDADHNPLPLDDTGFASPPAVHNASSNSERDRLPGGTYFFTVSSEQWQSTPFELVAVVQRYLELSGKATGTLVPQLRLALVKLRGVASGAAPLGGTLLPPGGLRSLGGHGGGSLGGGLTLAIPRGVASGTLSPYGRLKQTFRLTGAAVGTSSSIATMTSSRPYGSGY